MSHVRLLMFAAVCWPAAAQAIVNMEDLHLGTPKEGFSGNLELAVSGTSGNADKYDAALGTRLQWHHGAHTDFLVLDYAYGRSLGDTNANKGFLHARHIYQATARRAWEGFGQAERNEFTRLTFRGLLGGGARWTLSEHITQRSSYLGLGAFYEQEAIDIQSGSTEDDTVHTWRGNIYLVMKYQLNPQTRLLSSTYYQPRLDGDGDYRAAENASLVVKLAERLALKISIDAGYDSRPPQAVKQADVSYRTGISYAF